MKNKIGDTKTFLYIEICLYTDLEFEILLTTSMLNKVSLLGVDSLWGDSGDCMFTLTNWGS